MNNAVKARQPYMPKYVPGADRVLYLEGQQDAKSGVIKDKSGFGNHGTITGATWVRLSSGLWVLNFDGIDDTVNCGSRVSLNILSSFTLLAWIKKPAHQNTWITILSKGSYGWSYNLFIADTNKLFGGFYGVGVGSADILPLNQWTLVGIVFDDTADTMAIITNDKVEVSSGITLTPQEHSAESFFIGSDNGVGNFLLAQLALARVYSRSLSASKIAVIYQNERQLFGV
jgi:hypothetical protein